MSKKPLKIFNMSKDVKESLVATAGALVLAGATGWFTIAMVNKHAKESEILLEEQFRMEKQLNDPNNDVPTWQLEQNIKLLKEAKPTDFRYLELKKQILKEYKEKNR